MGYEDLKQKLLEYSQKLKSGNATVADHSAVKNHINDAYGAGSINNELKKELGQKATFAWQNRDRAKTASQVIPEILEKGGTVGKFAEAEAPSFGKVIQNSKGFSKLLPMLGMAAMAPAALGAAEKAQKGDLKGAAADVADTGSYFIPGVGEARMVADAAMGKIGTSPESEAIENPSAPNFRHNLAVNDSKMDSNVLPSAGNRPSIDATQEPEEVAKKKAFDALTQKLKPSL